MPVADHEVHPSVVNTDPTYYACQLKQRHDGYWAKDGYFVNSAGEATIRLEWVDDCLSKKCRYDMRDTDPGCNGCQQPKELFDSGGWQ